MAELLKVENLSAGYGEAVVLQEVSVSLNEGETLALLGRNGTGKTTFMNTLAGATRQHGGTITLGGVALHKLAQFERAAAGIGWVPQERNIFKSLTVDENLTAVARPARAGRATAVRFSCTVSDLKMLRSCGTQPMPAAARSCEGSLCRATPASSIVPACWRVAPARVSINVLLPVPLRPSNARVSPAASDRATPVRMTASP